MSPTNLAPRACVEIRDAEWVVHRVDLRPDKGHLIRIGLQKALFSSPAACMVSVDLDDNTLYKSPIHGQAPIIQQFDTAEEQALFIKELLDREDDLDLSSSCVVARTNREVQVIEGNLNALGVSSVIIKSSVVWGSQ